MACTGACRGRHGALFAITLKGIGLSGDGDSAASAWGNSSTSFAERQHAVHCGEQRRVWPHQGTVLGTARSPDAQTPGHQSLHAVDICLEPLAANATFVARSFAGDPKQVKELLKAAMAHNGIAVLDIISRA